MGTRQTIYIKHKDEVVEKLIEVIEHRKHFKFDDNGNVTESGWNNEGFIEALKWVLGLDENEIKDEEVYAVAVNKRYRKALNEIAEYVNKDVVIKTSDIFDMCYKALEEDDDET